MDASYSWHSGAHGLNPVWAIPVHLFPDEIFSSWLLRAALMQGCDPFVLTEKLWPKWRMWTLDLDRGLSQQRLVKLVEHSGIDANAFHNATLEPYARKICLENLPVNNIWPWIRALGIRNTKRRNGFQCCLKCLAESQTPYYRIQWRFAWHTACEKHGCLLIDHCKNCLAPIEPHRLIATDKHLAICATCKTDLRINDVEKANNNALKFQVSADKVLMFGNGHLLNMELESADWFLQMNFFLSLIRRSNKNAEKKLKNIVESLGIYSPKMELEEFGIELLNIRQRHFLFSLVYPLIECDVESLKSIILKSEISQEGLVPKNTIIPSSLVDIMTLIPSNAIERANRKLKNTPRSVYQVSKMMRRLQRKLEMSER